MAEPNTAPEQEARDAVIRAMYCQECHHPHGYHSADRGCSMPLDRAGLPVMRTSETVGICGCTGSIRGDKSGDASA